MSIRSLSTSTLTEQANYATMKAGALSPPYEVNFLVIAGGGGGGCESQRRGGGGGAGGYRCSMAGEYSGGLSPAESPLSLSPGTYTVTVGAGGAGGYNGSNSVFATVTSLGGGYGGSNAGGVPDTSGNGNSGGSGGGSHNTGSPGAGTSGQGFSGTDRNGDNADDGTGGGGASETRAFLLAAAYTGSGKPGGTGLVSGITGTPVWRGAGGSGGTRYGNRPTTGVPAGRGGGGTGESQYTGTQVTDGTANTGGGGGGGDSDDAKKFGSGGSGIVVIRMKSRIPVSFSGGVTYSTSTIGDETAYTVTATSSGSETVTIG